MAKRTPRSRRSETNETIRFLLTLALAALVLRSFVVALYSIPSESMLPTLEIGDYVLVTKWNYGYSRWSLPWGVPPVPGRVLGRTPGRGDVVVFRSPGGDHDVVKRVVGLPGDTLRMDHGRLVLNGRAVAKQRIADFTIRVSPNYRCDPAYRDRMADGTAICRYRRFRETLPDGVAYTVLDRGDFPDRDDTAAYHVPAGTVFVMGDNRDDSADSRFAPPGGMGYVPLTKLEGRAALTVFSTDGSAALLKPWTWFAAARPSRIGTGFQ